jgi:large subunit ribosomal protein L32
MRRSHHALTATGLGICQNCGEKTQPHHVCRNCGFYAKRTVINIDED